MRPTVLHSVKINKPIECKLFGTQWQISKLYVLVYFQVLEDPLQLKRLQCVIDGYVDEDCTTYEGMLGEPILFPVTR